MSDQVNAPLKFRSFGHAAAFACSLEAAAPKVGNVHRAADFPDLTFYDFLLSGQLLGETIDRGILGTLGELILAIVVATRRQVRSNSNLGIALLLAPLAQTLQRGSLTACHVLEVLESTSARDAQLIFEAIRVAQPGGLGQVPMHDVRGDSAPEHILEAMRLARDRDLIARQYCSGLADVFDLGVPTLVEQSERQQSLVRGIVCTHLRLIGELGDSLVGRKCGGEVEAELRARAAMVLERIQTAGWEAGANALADLDFWLRSAGNRLNPGTTADLMAATLYVAALTGKLLWRVP
jgi:triphosphoribosyl-dephospho-CoA synthase